MNIAGSMECPTCGGGVLEPFGRTSMRCVGCRQVIGGPLLETLKDIYGLPEALGHHACECGHPEMRRLPDGYYRCPNCGDEVMPATSLDGIPHTRWEPGYTEAYRCGWEDGRYGEIRNIAFNHKLARWSSPMDRLDFYRGRKQGTLIRAARNESEQEVA